ncbi:hypothetical protein Catovirus_1_73 [Catovirus CTV1]|uniref:Uncharacterized protein n=1 Tax=Catovirus CTV1 TaxID=1977631 RepID=A0A1V0S8I8_9VIRU|nr:hypothetical protein Catovirus_1_73 [Catovirus CTV1]
MKYIFSLTCRSDSENNYVDFAEEMFECEDIFLFDHILDYLNTIGDKYDIDTDAMKMNYYIDVFEYISDKYPSHADIDCDFIINKDFIIHITRNTNKIFVEFWIDDNSKSTTNRITLMYMPI